MAKKKPQKLPELTTSLMHGETEQQYHGWLLYNETGSLEKLLRAWVKIYQGYANDMPEIGGLRDKLNKPPALITLKTWCKKFQWVARTEMLLAEEMEHLKQKTEKFRAKRKFLVTDILMTKMTKLQKQARTEATSVLEIKYLWDMHRTEFGESTGKTEITHRIDESEQKPPTSEENKLGQEIDQLIKKHYEQPDK